MHRRSRPSRASPTYSTTGSRTGRAMNELEALRIRDEVLQAMYWMSSEGLAECPAASELAGFLAVPAAPLGPFLIRFAEDGFLKREGERFRLTEKGTELGKRSFARELGG